jgi:hypothetical protein
VELGFRHGGSSVRPSSPNQAGEKR